MIQFSLPCLILLVMTIQHFVSTSCYTVNRCNTTRATVLPFTQDFIIENSSSELYANGTAHTRRNNSTRDREEDFNFYFKLVEALSGSSIHVPLGAAMAMNATSNTTEESADLGVNVTTTENPRARIVGGDNAVEGEFKYQLSIRLYGRHHCGATLVAIDGEQFALTAAHCVRNAGADDLVLIGGDLTRSDRSGNEQARQVIDIVRHENFEFNVGVPSYDIALLFFEQPFTENNYIASIALPELGQETKGKVVVSGWGDYDRRYQGRPSDRLMKVEVPIVDFDTCKKSYSVIIDEFYDHFICSGYMQPGVYKDSCQGDSGGPVRSVDGGYLAGIVSWGAGCGIPRFPGVNTKVSYFVDWINDQVKKYKTGGSSSEEEDSSREEEEEEGDDARFA